MSYATREKWVTGSKQKAKACLKTETSYQDIVSHSQSVAILRITIIRAPDRFITRWQFAP
jgi:hypothetical protein